MPPGGEWINVQPYSTADTYTWTTTGLALGQYNWILWVRDTDGSGVNNWYEAFDGHSYSLKSAVPCTAAGISANPPSPAVGQTPIQIQGTASTCSSPLYQFWLQAPLGAYEMVQDFSPNDTYNWPTLSLPPGNYSFTVRVKDASSTNDYDAFTQMWFKVLDDTPCTAASISANPPSPGTDQTPIQIKGAVSTCPAPLYQFWLQPPGGQYSMVQDFSASDTYNWPAASMTPGYYSVTIRMKDSSLQGGYDTYDTYAQMWYLLGESTCSNAQLSVHEPTPMLSGPTIFTAGATGCAIPYYEFWKQAPGEPYVRVQGFSPYPDYSWYPSEEVPGIYAFTVRVKTLGSPEPFETFTTYLYELKHTGVRVHVYNVDDSAEVYLNGARVLETGYHGVSVFADVSAALANGTNTLRLVQTNYGGNWTYGLEVLIDGTVALHAECGTAGSYGCENNDYTKTGVVYDETFTFDWVP